VGEVALELEELMTRPDGPFVARLPREPGRREARYMQLFCGDAPPAADTADTPAVPATASALEERVAALEAEVADLRREMQALRSQG
jgi:hypothetical protein